jgi:hypothetical protein
MTGIMLCTVDEEQKTSAISLAFMFYNFLGLLPSKFIYGYVYDSGVGHNSAAAMATIMFSPIVPVVLYYLVGYLIIHNDVLKYEEPKESKACNSCCKMRCFGRLSFCCTPSVPGVKTRCCSRLSFCYTPSVPGVKKRCCSRLSCFRIKKVKQLQSPPF